MAISKAPWDGSAARFPTPEAYCASCLVDENPSGAAKKKSLCHLPVKEPGGAINVNGVHSAYGALVGARGGVKASPASKKAAARKLRGLYAQIKEPVPDKLKSM